MPIITVLYGGTSSEREVSLVSGENAAKALSHNYSVNLIDLKEDAIPEALISRTDTLVFPVLHGGFGENGELQKLLEQHDIPFVGCEAECSALCMDKPKTKSILKNAGIPVLAEIVFDSREAPNPSKIMDALGPELIIKPAASGSSVGLSATNSEAELEAVLKGLTPGSWMIEKWIRSREFTVGLLEGKALGIVEIKPRENSLNDYKHKYTPGTVDYQFPALLSKKLESEIKFCAEAAYDACGCRDFSRIDLVMDKDDRFYFLEINTLPGLTPNSTINRSAKCLGYDYQSLCEAIIRPGLRRHFQVENIYISNESI